MVKVIGIISVKGGVGKTTVASSMAVDLVNYYGKKVLLVDANYSAPNLGLHMDITNPESSIQEVLSGDAHFKSAIHNRYGVDVIPGDAFFQGSYNPLKLRDKLQRVKNEYDFVILDSSPNLNEEILSTMLSSDALFVVATGDYPTLTCSLQAAKLAKQRGRPIAGLILNKVRDPAYELSVKDIEEATGINIVARIPDERNHVRSVFTRIPMSLYKRNSKFSKEINALNSAITGEKQSLSILDIIKNNFSRENVNRQLLRENFYTNLFEDSHG
ncbi:MAG: MinD/ParA family protein [Nanoarchaeota archaeon]